MEKKKEKKKNFSTSSSQNSNKQTKASRSKMMDFIVSSRTNSRDKRNTLKSTPGNL